MPDPQSQLSRRERQLLDVIYERGRASAAEVLAAISDPPSYSAIRALLRILEEKGHLVHDVDKGRYIYRPTRPRGTAARSAMQRLLKTFFGGSASKAVAALLDASENLSDEELDRAAKLIEQARKEGR